LAPQTWLRPLQDHLDTFPGPHDDVQQAGLLRSLGLEQYEDAIDDSVLPDLTDQDLE
jgi:hypothetical protein